MRKILKFVILVYVVFIASGCCLQGKKKIGIAWRANLKTGSYVNACRAIEAAGGEPVLLGQVVSSELPYVDGRVSSTALDKDNILLQEYADKIKNAGFRKSNAASVMKGINAVVFTGGEDISPTLYAKPVPWHGLADDKNYNATRDVSDYLLMAYCLDQDIAVLGVCRGCQVLGVVSGAGMIQDIPDYYSKHKGKEDYSHRQKKVGNTRRDYTSHPVKVTHGNSIFARIAGGEVMAGCPSWHHQAVDDIEGTGLIASGITTIHGLDIIEVIENPSKRFAIGVQFHPEAAVGKVMNNAANKGDYMSFEQAVSFFKAIIAAAPEAQR